LQAFCKAYPLKNSKDEYHPLGHKYWIRPIRVVRARLGITQFVFLAAFQATAATLMLVGLVQAAKGVHITEHHELKPLGPGRAPSSLVQLWEAFKAFRTAALKLGRTESQLEGEWNAKFSEAFRPHFATFHRPGSVLFYTPDVVAGAIGGASSTSYHM
jgi:hypothetical protein